MKDKVVLVCAGNENFIVPMKVMLRSVLCNTSREVRVFVMEKAWGDEQKDAFRKSFVREAVDIQFVSVADYAVLKEFKLSDSITIESYFRLFIPEVLPEDVERAIYLDGDIIVESDIAELWEKELGDYAVMAVPEMCYEAHYVSSPIALKTWRELYIPPGNKYFNAGVLLMNLKKWRRYNITEKVTGYLTEYKEQVLWHDQDGLNAVLWNDWKELEGEWNVMTALYQETEYERIDIEADYAKRMQESPKLIHYTNSKEKPWMNSCRHPLKKRYQYYKDLVD